MRAVVAEGSFSAAGKQLALTQPAVSRQISVLEAQVGLRLVRRTQRGVQATEAGRLLVGHAEAIMERLALAGAQLDDLRGVRRGTVRLGSFFTALVHLSVELGSALESSGNDIRIQDDLVDRDTAYRKLRAGELDVAVVFDPGFTAGAVPEGIELVPMFEDPLRVLLPPAHPLGSQDRVALAALTGDTWIRPHDGSAAELVDHALRTADLTPPLLLAGHGDEPVELQALVAAGRGVTVAYDLNVLVTRHCLAIRPTDPAIAPRLIAAATVSGYRAPAVEAVLELLQDVGRRHARRLTETGSEQLGAPGSAEPRDGVPR